MTPPVAFVSHGDHHVHDFLVVIEAYVDAKLRRLALVVQPKCRAGFIDEAGPAKKQQRAQIAMSAA